MKHKKRLHTRLLSVFLVLLLLMTAMPFSAITASAAPASDLPDNMVDSAILRALEYTGYDVQKQKNDGTLYQYGSYGSRTPSAILSNITYNGTPSGQETVADSSTVTGKAPNIARFEQYGLVCASFVTYFICNYLPNIEGADTQFITDAVNATGMNSQAVVTWQTALNKLANEGKIEKIGTSSSNVDRSKLAPGDLIIFGTSENSHTHIAVYSGTYNGVDFIIHVGNERGPEISRVDWMGQAGDKSSYPNAYFHLDEEIFQQQGAIEVKKVDENGKALSGAVFVATNTADSSIAFKIGPTNSSGYATTGNTVPFGTYKVKETVFPTGYQSSGTSEWTVTLNKNTPNGTITINAVNEQIPGNCKIVKTSEDGKVADISFTLTGNGVNKTVKTNASGEIQINNLRPGQYVVTEQNYDKYEPQEARTVTVVSGQTATVTFNNTLRRGDLKVTKTSEDGLVEGVKFHLYGTSLSGLAVDEYAVTDKNGVATFTDVLISGHESYVLEEVDTAERYIVPESQRTAVEWNKVTEKSFYNELKRGDLTVKKTSEDGFVKGMKFRLHGTSFSGIKVDEYATTDSNGIAYFNDILMGAGFVLEEVNTPVRYVIPDRQTADIAWNELTETEFTNILKKWRADVYKVDSDLAGESGGGSVGDLVPVALSLTTEETVEELGSPYGDSQGDATLAGAVYGVYKGSELIDTYTTDDNGYFLTKYYPCGDDWTIREITPSQGYLLDPTVYYMDASAEFYSIELNTIYPDVYEEIIKGNIAIIKHTDDGSTQIETPEVGATFEVYLKSAGSYKNAEPTERDILVCDEDGFAKSIDLPYGVYIVHQTKGWEGRELMPDFEVQINENGKCYKYLINNANFAAYLKIVKVDSETGKIIPYAGATFEIYDPDGKLVEMTTTYPEVVKHTQFKTNAEGYLITPEVLEYGLQYSIVELVAPYGYVLDSTPVYFDVSADNSEIAEGITVVKTEKKNAPQKGVINIYKSGEIFSSVTVTDDKYTPVYAEGGLDGTEFDVIADEDIITPDGTLRYSKDEVVDHIITSGGNATSKALYLGKYRIVETKASYGMVLNKDILYAELTYAGQEIELTSTSVAMYNERQKASITLSKIMEQNDIFGIGNNGEIKKVSFGLYAAEKLTAADGTFVPVDGLLEVVYCDENGKITFNSDIPVGAKLYVQELTTDEHYIVSSDKHLIQFDYAEQTVTLVDIKVNNDTAIDNKLIYGSVQGLKLDEDGKPIVGAVFGLFAKDETEFTEENALMTAVSGEDGVFIFEKIAFGSWVIREIKTASEEYVLNDTVYLVEITEDGVVIEYELENRFVRGSVQVTKVDADYPDTKLTGAVFEIYLDVDGNKEYNADIDTLVGEMSETELGVYRMDELKYGGYFLYEKISPDNFVKVDEYFYFEIKVDGEVVKVENLEGVGFANKPVVGSLKIVKTSSDGKIEGFSFRVTGENGYDQIFKTNANGEIIIEGLRLGKYTVSEVSDDISAGYILAEDVTVTIEADKEVIAEMHNEKKPVPEHPDSPQTGDNSNIGLWIFLMLASATALVVLLFVSKRKEVQ